MYEEVTKLPDYEVAFVWNRTDDKMKGVVADHLILQDLGDFSSRYHTCTITFADRANCPCRSADLIVEVAHPSIGAEYGAEFLKAADFMVQICLLS